MPEYLAPAVYVEEVDTGSKPIEGVSTSTAGVVGVTERGPVDVPMLVTSNGEYQRLFGQLLSDELFDDHRFLPHAVEGFFTNGGKRLFVTRVLDRLGAVAASRQLVAPDAAGTPEARVLLAGAPAAGTIVIDADPGFANGDTVQIDDGLSAEFHTLNAAPAAAAIVPLRVPLSFDHAAADTVRLWVDASGAGEVHNEALTVAANAGENWLTVTNPPVFAPAIGAGNLLRVGNAAADDEDIVEVAGFTAPNIIDLVAPLAFDHAIGAVVFRLETQGAPTAIPAGVTVAAGSMLVPVASTAGLAADTLVEIDSAANPANLELRRVGVFHHVTLDQPAYADYDAATTVERVTAGAAGVVADLNRDAFEGDTVIAVSSRLGVNAGAVVALGVGPTREIVQVASVPGRLPAPDAGNVVLTAPLRFDHTAAAGIVAFAAAPATPVGAARVVTDAAMGSTQLAVNRTIGAGSLLRVTTAAGGPYFHTVTAASAAYAPQTLSLTNPLTAAHVAGVAVARRTPMIDVVAIDQGSWGNRLRVAMEQQDTPLLTTTIRQVLPGNRIRLASASGVEVGTDLVITNGGGVADTFRVRAIDRQDDYLITLEAAPVLAGVGPGHAVVSREFRFVVELLRQPDATNPARNTMAIDREVFANLSLDARHSRYFETVIGTTWNVATATTDFDDRGRRLRRADRRSEGESQYVRVFDVGFATSDQVRGGPVASYITQAGGARKLVLLPLGNGDDSIATLSDQSYIGQDSVNPEERTGLQALRNLEEISIVAAPGRTEPTIQMSLINHCELMRYRFAVLDGPAPPADSIPDVQAQRQQFDTKYAALYHPWLLITDPYPVSSAARQDYPIAPSGHMLGIYARTDIERGVHKAPANEVVRGVLGLQRVLNKEQHDLLNPYPVNINVIRDFRTNNRGIRVYGGRCITSDSDWKYVNVRRLLIFIEASIDRGLQWVVFEPNAEPLWARVRRSIANFLTLVWRNGGLEGTKVDEAFFVKCDRTTMTQTDIDQGRLICVVGVAPVKPAEFVIVRIGLWTAHAEE